MGVFATYLFAVSYTHLAKYAHKGTKFVIEGRIQTGSYTNKDGQKVYTTDVIVEQVEFAESKTSANENATSNTTDFNVPAGTNFMDTLDDVDEELPFN